MRVAAFCLVTWVALPGSATLAQQTSETEREVLARLAGEIDHLAPLIETAKARADQAARLQFDYPALRRDLGTLRTRIDTYLAGQRRQPRSLGTGHGS